MTQTRIIYSLVSKGRQTILSSYTEDQGNFDLAALEVLKKCRFQEDGYDRFSVMHYMFYTLAHSGFLFLVMVDHKYETRIAAKFLKNIQQQFFDRYDNNKRKQANSHSLKQFNKVLKQKAAQYKNKEKVDKLYNLKKQLSELEDQSLQNLDKVIQRGIKIEILVQKSAQLNDISLGMFENGKQINSKMKWKNRKIIIGIISAVAIVITVVVLAIIL